MNIWLSFWNKDSSKNGPIGQMLLEHSQGRKYVALMTESLADQVGKVDWELQRFHGDEFTTNQGSTCNSYLIQEEKKRFD